MAGPNPQFTTVVRVRQGGALTVEGTYEGGADSIAQTTAIALWGGNLRVAILQLDVPAPNKWAVAFPIMDTNVAVTVIVGLTDKCKNHGTAARVFELRS
jgi:hypothetical protein